MSPRIAVRRPSRATPPSAAEAALTALLAGDVATHDLLRALAVVEQDPLANGGRFPGDVLRALTLLPGRAWARHPTLYERYRAAVRAGALARRALPPHERERFWSTLDPLE